MIQPNSNPKNHNKFLVQKSFPKKYFFVFLLVLLCGIIILYYPNLTLLYRQIFHIPRCGTPQVTVGTTTFKIKSVELTPGNELPIPDNKNKQTAYWIEGSNNNYDLTLNATLITDLIAKGIEPGLPIDIRWGDCSEEKFEVTSLEENELEQNKFLDQTVGGIRLYVKNNDTGKGFTILGTRFGTLVKTSPEPTNPDAINAEVSYDNNVISDDGKKVIIDVSITNKGPKLIELTQDKVSLKTESEEMLILISEIPVFPITINPNETKKVTFNYSYSGEKALVFKLLDFSVEFYY